MKSSGLSVAAFARQRGVAAHRLYWIMRKARLAQEKAEPSGSGAEFNEVVVSDCASRQTAPIELRLPSGLSIGVTRDFDEVALQRLVGLLSRC